jgi:hypothetical protein
MKKLFLLLVTAAAFTTGHAQTFLIRPSLELGFPIGLNATTYSFAIGGSLEGEVKPTETLGITANVGYMTYTGSATGLGNISVIPVLGGVKYYIGRAFVRMQAGAAFGTQSGGGAFFTYSPGVGHKFFKEKLDVEAKFTGMHSVSYGFLNSLGLRIGYAF